MEELRNKFKFKKKNIYIVLGMAVIILYFVLKDEFNTIISYMINANPWWLSLGVICIIIFWLAEAKTMHIMIRAYEPKYKYFKVLKLVVSTQFFNGITPFSTGGQPFQIYVLNKRSKMKLSSITSISLQNFIVYQSVLVVFGVLAMITTNIFNMFPNEVSNMRLFAILGFALNTIIILFLIALLVLPRFTQFLTGTMLNLLGKTPLIKDVKTTRKKLMTTINHFYLDVQHLWKDKRLFVRAVILNALKLLFFYAIAYFVAKAVGVSGITVLQAIIASAYVMLLTSLVPIPGASGGAEFGFLLFFGGIIIGPQVTAIMLLWRFVTYYVGLFTGFFVFTLGYAE